MGFPFITDSINRFNNLAETPATILEATTYPLRATNIIICNRGLTDIRINLQISTTEPAIDPTYVVSQVLVKGYNNASSPNYNTIDLIEVIGKSDFKLNNVNDSLICFSNGYTQVFDCTVMYYTLNEIPFS